MDQSGLPVLAEFGVEAEASALGDSFSPGRVRAFAVVVVAARVTVGLVVCEHVPDGGEDVVLEGDVRALSADPRGELALPGPEICVLRAPCRTLWLNVTFDVG